MPETVERVFISLGSNLGDVEQNLKDALDRILHFPDVHNLQVSSIYLTEPQGVPDQPWFANQVAMLLCGPSWSPRTFLRALLDVEDSLGRVRVKRWGPRVIDLDLLLFGNHTISEPDIILPHPRMKERAFVLVPLHEIAPDVQLPSGECIKGMLDVIDYEIADTKIWQRVD